MFLFGDKNKSFKRNENPIMKNSAPVEIQIDTSSETLKLVTDVTPNLSVDNLNKFYTVFVEDEKNKERDSLVPPKIDALNEYNKKRDDKKYQEVGNKYSFR